ncbi:hypothetical protein BN1058_01116 [Paraliobacillus sp. PM-2]|uniref:DUF2759 family protein n=1 Tax=Paraliobacillus sp. PM-2 TaxID=1462524 RepID=UPI00061C1BED|nr:DUF2759 family protein [Paraliobacillus sp. PM-2]CQR46839.1 hypothetical protein BN1058_01116 [Paraliobacillus sp. PM-2]
MALAMILLIITCLSGAALCREIKAKDIIAVLFTGSSAIIFGFFSIATILSSFY